MFKYKYFYLLLFEVVVYALAFVGQITTTDILMTSTWFQRLDSPDHAFRSSIMQKYLFMIGIGTLIALIIQFVNFDLKRILSRFEIWLIPAICLPILPLLFRDYALHYSGATRYFGFHYLWIHTGFWSCVCYLISSAIITANDEKINWFKSTLLITGTAIIGFCMLRQRDLPMLLTLFFIITSFLFLNDKKVTALIFIGAACTLFSMYLIYKSGYEVQRIMGFYGLTDPWGASYQIIESRRCFKIAGLFGSPVSCMPPQPFDMIFAVFASMRGFANIIFFLVLHGMFFSLGYKAVSLVKGKTEALVLKGSLFLLAYFVIAGIAASTNMLPIFYPIPFSYGGTMMIFSFIVAGLLFRSLFANRKEVAAHNPYISLVMNKTVICYLVILLIIAVRCAYLCSL